MSLLCMHISPTCVPFRQTRSDITSMHAPISYYIPFGQTQKWCHFCTCTCPLSPTVMSLLCMHVSHTCIFLVKTRSDITSAHVHVPPPPPQWTCAILCPTWQNQKWHHYCTCVCPSPTTVDMCTPEQEFFPLSQSECTDSLSPGETSDLGVLQTIFTRKGRVSSTPALDQRNICILRPT